MRYLPTTRICRVAGLARIAGPLAALLLACCPAPVTAQQPAQQPAQQESAAPAAPVSQHILAPDLRSLRPVERPLALPVSTLPGAMAQLPYRASILAAGGVGPYTFMLGGALPDGITAQISPYVLALSGAPTVTGDYPLRISLSDASGAALSSDYTLHVDATPVHPELSQVTINDAEAVHITDSLNVFFPAVISISQVIHTSDADTEFGADTIADAEAIHVHDTYSVFFGAIISDAEVLHINDTYAVSLKLGIVPTTVPSGIILSTYPSTTFSAVGNTGTVAYSESGTLPTGMSWTTSGGKPVLSGTPTQSGNFPFTVTATDSLNSTTVPYTLVIKAAADSTTTVVGVTSNSITVGDTPSLTATITDTVNAATKPTGTATFYDTLNGSTTTIATGVSVTNGVATYTYTASLAGAHTITAAYTPSGAFNSSSDTTGKPLTVAKATQTGYGYTSATTQGTPSILSFLFSYPGSVAPTGTITVTVDGSTANLSGLACTYKALHSNCQVTYTAPANLSTAKSHPIVFTQAADANYNISSGSGLLLVRPAAGNSLRPPPRISAVQQQ